MANSWNEYINSLLGSSKSDDGATHIEKACIIGKDGSIWTSNAHTANLPLSAAEALNIGKCFQTKNFSQMTTNGVIINGVNYLFLRNDDTTVYAKRKGQGSLTLQASKTAVVIAKTKEGGQQGSSNKAVNGIATYLESLNM